MHLLQASDAQRVAELSSHQLREWCIRRQLVPPDVLPQGPGRHALYSWRTILVLRLARELVVRFAIELASWRNALQALRLELAGKPFHVLWGDAVLFRSGEDALLRSLEEVIPSGGLILPLDPHLDVIARNFHMSARPGQYNLFPATIVASRGS